MTMPVTTHQFSTSKATDDSEQLIANVTKMVEALHPVHAHEKALELGRRLAAARRRHNELDENSLDLPNSNR